MYQDIEGIKRRISFHERALYSNGTLTIVTKELKKRLHLYKMTFSVMDPQERLLAGNCLREIEERLEIRNQVRLAEIHLGVRRRLPRVTDH